LGASSASGDLGHHMLSLYIYLVAYLKLR
jgi:hypothetical protein